MSDREPAPTVQRPRASAAPTVVLGDGGASDEELRIVAGTGCALQVVAAFALVLTVAWLLVTVVFAGRLLADAPVLGRAVVVAQGLLALGALVGGVQVVRFLRAVQDARRGRPIAVQRALAAHRDTLATAVGSVLLTLFVVLGGAIWWLLSS